MLVLSNFSKFLLWEHPSSTSAFKHFLLLSNFTNLAHYYQWNHQRFFLSSSKEMRFPHIHKDLEHPWCPFERNLDKVFGDWRQDLGCFRQALINSPSCFWRFRGVEEHHYMPLSQDHLKGEGALITPCSVLIFENRERSHRQTLLLSLRTSQIHLPRPGQRNTSCIWYFKETEW